MKERVSFQEKKKARKARGSQFSRKASKARGSQFSRKEASNARVSQF